jgi:hypothetical protein
MGAHGGDMAIEQAQVAQHPPVYVNLKQTPRP